MEPNIIEYFLSNSLHQSNFPYTRWKLACQVSTHLMNGATLAQEKKKYDTDMKETYRYVV